MALYLMLTTLTEKGVQTLNSNPARLREVNRDIEELGREILHQWASLGEYDFVNVVEAPDDLTIARVSRRARRARQLEDRVVPARLGRRPALLARGLALTSAVAVSEQRSRTPSRVATTGAGSTGKPGGRIEVEPARRDVVRRVRDGRARRGAGSGRARRRARTGRRRRHRSRCAAQ